jgi:hypothetical protein
MKYIHGCWLNRRDFPSAFNATEKSPFRIIECKERRKVLLPSTSTSPRRELFLLKTFQFQTGAFLMPLSFIPYYLYSLKHLWVS